MRPDNRDYDQRRPCSFQRDFTKYSQGSVWIKTGDTQVLCTASVEDSVPPFLKGAGTGWVTAEYAMLPSATHTRNRREVTKGKASGRTNEIQRLIGRSLRAIIDTKKLGERSITIDCDVIQADGGTRTAAITGGMLALHDAVNTLLENGSLKENPIIESCAAISVGIVNGTPCLDLNYEEDFAAEVDMNVVMSESGKFIEVQGTAEEHPFDRDSLNALLDLAEKGNAELIEEINKSLGTA